MPINIRIRCAICQKGVDSVEEYYDPVRDVVGLYVGCHGEVEMIEVSYTLWCGGGYTTLVAFEKSALKLSKSKKAARDVLVHLVPDSEGPHDT